MIAPLRCEALRFALIIFAVTVWADRVQGKEVTAEVREAYTEQIFHSAGDRNLPYRILAPAKIQPGIKYPLVIFFHGAGERGTDNEAQLVHAAGEFHKRLEKHPAFVIFPQCPKEKRWVESPWDLPSGKGQFTDEPSESMKLALELVDSLSNELPIDTNRRYVCGLSMGGQGAWFAAASKPRRFAAMVEVCGGGDPTWATRYAGLPVWAFHGQEDNVVPISRGREMIQALAENGHHPEVRYVEYPGVKHDSWTQTFNRDDVFQWLFSQKKQ